MAIAVRLDQTVNEKEIALKFRSLPKPRRCTVYINEEFQIMSEKAGNSNEQKKIALTTISNSGQEKEVEGDDQTHAPRLMRYVIQFTVGFTQEIRETWNFRQPPTSVMKNKLADMQQAKNVLQFNLIVRNVQQIRDHDWTVVMTAESGPERHANIKMEILESQLPLGLEISEIHFLN